MITKRAPRSRSVRGVPVKREEGEEQAGEGDEARRVKQIPPLRGRRSRSRAEKKTGRSVRDDRLGRAALSDLKVRPPKRAGQATRGGPWAVPRGVRARWSSPPDGLKPDF